MIKFFALFLALALSKQAFSSQCFVEEILNSNSNSSRIWALSKSQKYRISYSKNAIELHDLSNRNSNGLVKTSGMVLMNEPFEIRSADLIGQDFVAARITNMNNQWEDNLHIYQVQPNGQLKEFQIIEANRKHRPEFMSSMGDKHILITEIAFKSEFTTQTFVYKRDGNSKFKKVMAVTDETGLFLGSHPKNPNLVFIEGYELGHRNKDGELYFTSESIMMYDLSKDKLSVLMTGLTKRPENSSGMIAYQETPRLGFLADDIIYIGNFENISEIKPDGSLRSFGSFKEGEGRRSVFSLSARRFLILDDSSWLSGDAALPMRLRTFNRKLSFKIVDLTSRGSIKEYQKFSLNNSFNGEDPRAVGLSVYPLNNHEFLLYGRGEINVFRDNGNQFVAAEAFDVPEVNGFARVRESKPYILNGNEMKFSTINDSRFILSDNSRVSAQDLEVFQTSLFGFERINCEYEMIGGVRLPSKSIADFEATNEGDVIISRYSKTKGSGTDTVMELLEWSSLK